MTSLLAATSIVFAYGGTPVLRGVDLSLSAGQLVALLGPNGSGKTTLLRCLLGQLHAAGAVQWNGKSVRSLGTRQLARTVAYLPQNPSYEPGQTVFDVLRTGRLPFLGAFGIEQPADISVVSAIAHQLGVADDLSRQMSALSGGQRQRVFVGRCLVQEPSALLLDEPATHLDLKHQLELCTLLRSLSREHNKAILMASHDLNLSASFADRLVLLNDGVVAASGTPDQVMDEQLLSSVYGVKLRRVDERLVFPALDV